MIKIEGLKDELALRLIPLSNGELKDGLIEKLNEVPTLRLISLSIRIIESFEADYLNHSNISKVLKWDERNSVS